MNGSARTPGCVTGRSHSPATPPRWTEWTFTRTWRLWRRYSLAAHRPDLPDLGVLPWCTTSGPVSEAFAARYGIPAAYGVSQDAAMMANFGPHSTPWLLKGMFCPYTVQPEPDRLPGRNATWSTSFRDLQ